MYDPIPWHIDDVEARRRGLNRSGWYLMGYDGRPIVGPHGDPETCVMAVRDLPEPRSRPALRVLSS
jgi:hypothetical protein